VEIAENREDLSQVKKGNSYKFKRTKINFPHINYVAENSPDSVASSSGILGYLDILPL
jgi:hypothetical protein